MTQVQIPCGCIGSDPKCEKGKRLHKQLLELSGQIDGVVEGEAFDQEKYVRLLLKFHLVGDAWLKHIGQKPVERYR